MPIRQSLRAEIDDQVFSARTLAEALMQLFSVCKWPSKNQGWQEYSATIAETLQKGFLATCRWLPARFRKTFLNIEITSAVFQLAAILFDFSYYVTMLLTLLCLSAWRYRTILSKLTEFWPREIQRPSPGWFTAKLSN